MKRDFERAAWLPTWFTRGRLAALGITLSLLAGPSTQAAREIPNFSLLDLGGRNHELYRADGKAVVLFFTGVGCPIARKSAAKLRDLREQFADRGVSIWIINTYPSDSRKDAWKEVNELDLHGFPYLPDRKQGVALALGVERTAEVVLVETADWKVLYQGAIDDQFTEGSELPAARNKYLETALTDYLEGRAISLSKTQARGCRIAFTSEEQGKGAPSYATEVAPILRKSCAECHRDGGIGPWALDSYARAKNYSRMIEEVLLTRRMPPWDADPDAGSFANAHRLSTEESQTLLRWVHAGAPRGDESIDDPLAAPLPPLRDWPHGTPDLVLRLPEPQSIPATGVLDYRHIALPKAFTNDLWIAATDIRPGNRKVVHHVILYAKWSGCPDDGSGKGVFVCGWAPGTPPSHFPAGAAKFLPANADLTAEVHYTTCGSPQTDQSEIAIYLAPGPQPYKVEVRAAIESDVNIPPRSDEARHSATYAFEKPAVIYSLSPHMHFRGKWMRYELLLPGGRKETLLYVPRYDFKWQLTYILKEPRHVPAGAWLLVTGAFDNSPSNPANPDPEKRVHFGAQSWDEMFIGFFEAADVPAASAKPSATLSSTAN